MCSDFEASAVVLLGAVWVDGAGEVGWVGGVVGDCVSDCRVAQWV